MSTEHEPQPDTADLIDALADYYVAREGVLKAEAVSVLTAMSPERLRAFADMTMAEVAEMAVAEQATEGSRIALPRRKR